MKKACLALSVVLTVCLMMTGVSVAEEAGEAHRVTFLLLCNEGMSNDGGNVGNTMMVISLDPDFGDIRLLMFTWDTFIDYEGYDIPQLLDQPYRQNGPEGTLKAFNANFGQQIDRFLSVNYLNLAGLIDSYGGVEVDITRAERNALNSMVASKKENVKAIADMGLLEQALLENLMGEYYLDEWGEGTHLNGLQSVAFGWLQYDSVYNCCLREVKVISDLFNSVGETIGSEIAFYTEETGIPQDVQGKRLINLDAMTEEDETFLYQAVSPIFDMSYNNLTHDDIVSISIALARSAYKAARQGYNVFKNVTFEVLPLEAREPYETVAGRKGHVIDYEANTAAVTHFLFDELDGE